MNAPDKFTSLLTLTREPFPASHKCVIPGSRPDLFVPVRDVQLTNGEIVSLYGKLGSGSAEVAETVFGLHKLTSGEATVQGHAHEADGPAASTWRWTAATWCRS